MAKEAAQKNSVKIFLMFYRIFFKMFLRTVRKEICRKSGSARSSSVLYSSNSSGMGRHNSYPSFIQSVCTPGNSFAESIRSRQKFRKSTRGGFVWGCRTSRFKRMRRFPECLQLSTSFISSSCLSYSHSFSLVEKWLQTHNA